MTAVKSAPNPEMTKCVICEREISKGTVECPHCKASQESTFCKVCYAKIPKLAKRCEHCHEYQFFWRRVVDIPQTTYTTLTALIAVIGLVITPASNYFNRHSNTKIAFVNADPDYIRADIFNSGRSSSIVRKASLQFPGVPIQAARLSLVLDEKGNVQRIVRAGGDVRLKLQVPGLQWADSAKGANRGDVLKKINGSEVVLDIDIEESTGPPAVPHTDTFPGYEIARLIEHKLPNPPSVP
jgi:hypothetical protein